MEQKFSLQSTFRPHYSPREMLSLGVFGGAFYEMASSRVGLPAFLLTRDWKLSHVLWANNPPVAEVNRFEILADNRNRGMENAPLDARARNPNGWFQWYTRFFLGDGFLDASEDEFRIAQWRKEVKALYFALSGATTDADKNLYKQHLLQYAWDWEKSPSTLL